MSEGLMVSSTLSRPLGFNQRKRPRNGDLVNFMTLARPDSSRLSDAYLIVECHVRVNDLGDVPERVLSRAFDIE